MTRLVLSAAAAAFLFCLCAAPAGAEVRTASAATKYPSPELSSPTRPEMDRVAFRYDDQAGNLQLTMFFHEPMADPAATSALRSWRYFVQLGDYLNGICTGQDNSGLLLGGRLTDPAQAYMDSTPDFSNTYADAPVTQTLNPDRSELHLEITDPRLVGLNLICADVRVRDTRESRSADSSDTFAFLFDGFDAADGALAREITSYLWFETDLVATRLRNKVGRSLAEPVCRELWKAEFSCRASGRLKNVRGGARITLRGRMRFDARGARKLGGIEQHGWLADMRATLSWKRCPKDARKSLRGKPCHITARWTGNKLLVDALGV